MSVAFGYKIKQFLHYVLPERGRRTAWVPNTTDDGRRRIRKKVQYLVHTDTHTYKQILTGLRGLKIGNTDHLLVQFLSFNYKSTPILASIWIVLVVANWKIMLICFIRCARFSCPSL